jgi:hypothetical protein
MAPSQLPSQNPAGDGDTATIRVRPDRQRAEVDYVEITNIVGVTAVGELLQDPTDPMNSYGFLRILQSSLNSNYYCR